MIKKGMTPAEFNSFLNKKLDEDDIDLFYRANFINPLRSELFKDFTISLVEMIHSTYPGDDINSENYYLNHYRYCFNTVKSNFEIEGLFFEGSEDDTFDYFYQLFEETYYPDENKGETIKHIKILYEKVFNLNNMDKTQSDLELFLEVYKVFIKLFKKDKKHESVATISK